ncbi:hypothetical protein [Pseudonocardia humida]|uniref:ABC-2 type transport system permease protein n=1 Tax=Pseudonocardia humida TaxID=2800819 RepID=A0ABT1A871_9PSEU|nr:hypothetical protein [Pseudonocardia humida]MCO1659156.1 hypothetical protein [Pseudonocardia humida]
MSGPLRRTGAAVGYLLALLVGEQRVLLPPVAFLAVLGVLFGGDPGPPPTPWAASALAIYPAAAWVALVVANVEDPVQRAVTVTAAGGRGIVATATVLVALAADLLMVAMAVLLPLVVGRYAYPPATVAMGAVAHLACASAGTAVGLLCARPLVRRVGWSFCLAATVVVVTAVQPWLPPVGAAVRALSSGGAIPVGPALVGLAAAGAAALLSWWVDTRR